MSKFASSPSANHYDKLKNIAKYLQITRNWGFIFKRSAPRTELPIGTAKSIPIDDKLPVSLAMMMLLMVMTLRRGDLLLDMPSLILVDLLSIGLKLSQLKLLVLLKLNSLLPSLLLKLKGTSDPSCPN